MYVYLDFLFAKVGDLLIVGVLRQPFFYYYYLCIFQVPTFSSVHHSSGSLLVLFPNPAVVLLWYFCGNSSVSTW